MSFSSNIFHFGDFTLDLDQRVLLENGKPVAVTPKSLQLLKVLVEDRGRIVEKEALIAAVWPDSFVEESNLTFNISQLRKILGDTKDKPIFIETVARRGYRFVASVEESSAGKISADRKKLTSPEATPTPTVSIRRWPWVLGGLILLSALILGLNAGGLRDRLWGNPDPTPIQSLAVLPLENLSGDTSQDYFVDGMTGALIADLAKIGNLRVIALPSVMQYKGVQKPLSDIGRELNVDTVLTGSVLRSGDRMRIAVQLTDVATNRNLWAESYERDVNNILALQRDVARDIAGEIRPLTPQEEGQFASVLTVNPEAYDQYLRGKFYLHRQDKDNNETAISSFERSVEIDPAFAAAHAELAQAYTWKLFLFSPDDEQLAEKAFVSAEKALALDPNLAVAYLARGRLLWSPANKFPHEKSIREYRRALELDPNLDEARNQLALVYGHIGAFDEALRESRSAIATNPTNNLAQIRIGQTLNFQGKHEDALGVLRSIPPKVNAALVGHQMAWALFNLGRNEEASDLLDQLLKTDPADNGGLFTSIQAVLAAAAGQERVAESKIERAVEIGEGYGHFHHTAYHIACAYALMNKPEKAIKYLELAAGDGFPCYPLFEKDPNLDNLRQDPRFAAFLTKLQQQWEHHRSIL